MNMLLQSLLLLSLFLVVMVLLVKAKLLPLYLYLTVAEFIGPALKADHRLVYYGIAALLVLLPAAYWGLRLYRYVQEGRAARGALLARAYGGEGRHRFQTPAPAAEAEAKEMEVDPEPGTDDWYDYWYDR